MYAQIIILYNLFDEEIPNLKIIYSLLCIEGLEEFIGINGLKAMALNLSNTNKNFSDIQKNTIKNRLIDLIKITYVDETSKNINDFLKKNNNYIIERYTYNSDQYSNILFKDEKEFDGSLLLPSFPKEGLTTNLGQYEFIKDQYSPFIYKIIFTKKTEIKNSAGYSIKVDKLSVKQEIFLITSFNAEDDKIEEIFNDGNIMEFKLDMSFTYRAIQNAYKNIKISDKNIDNITNIEIDNNIIINPLKFSFLTKPAISFHHFQSVENIKNIKILDYELIIPNKYVKKFEKLIKIFNNKKISSFNDKSTERNLFNVYKTDFSGILSDLQRETINERNMLTIKNTIDNFFMTRYLIDQTIEEFIYDGNLFIFKDDKQDSIKYNLDYNYIGEKSLQLTFKYGGIEVNTQLEQLIRSNTTPDNTTLDSYHRSLCSCLFFETTIRNIQKRFVYYHHLPFVKNINTINFLRTNFKVESLEDGTLNFVSKNQVKVNKIRYISETETQNSFKPSHFLIKGEGEIPVNDSYSILELKSNIRIISFYIKISDTYKNSYIDQFTKQKFEITLLGDSISISSETELPSQVVLIKIIPNVLPTISISSAYLLSIDILSNKFSENSDKVNKIIELVEKYDGFVEVNDSIYFELENILIDEEFKNYALNILFKKVKNPFQYLYTNELNKIIINDIKRFFNLSIENVDSFLKKNLLKYDNYSLPSLEEKIIKSFDLTYPITDFIVNEKIALLKAGIYSDQINNIITILTNLIDEPLDIIVKNIMLLNNQDFINIIINNIVNSFSEPSSYESFIIDNLKQYIDKYQIHQLSKYEYLLSTTSDYKLDTIHVLTESFYPIVIKNINDYNTENNVITEDEYNSFYYKLYHRFEIINSTNKSPSSYLYDLFNSNVFQYSENVFNVDFVLYEKYSNNKNFICYIPKKYIGNELKYVENDNVIPIPNLFILSINGSKNDIDNIEEKALFMNKAIKSYSEYFLSNTKVYYYNIFTTNESSSILFIIPFKFLKIPFDSFDYENFTITLNSNINSNIIGINESIIDIIDPSLSIYNCPDIFDQLNIYNAYKSQLDDKQFTLSVDIPKQDFKKYGKKGIVAADYLKIMTVFMNDLVKKYPEYFLKDTIVNCDRVTTVENSVIALFTIDFKFLKVLFDSFDYGNIKIKLVSNINISDIENRITSINLQFVDIIDKLMINESQYITNSNQLIINDKQKISINNCPDIFDQLKIYNVYKSHLNERENLNLEDIESEDKILQLEYTSLKDDFSNYNKQYQQKMLNSKLSLSIDNINWSSTHISDLFFTQSNKPLWKTLSPKGDYLILGYENGVKIYSVVSNIFVFIGNYEHMNVSKVIFGENGYFITFQEIDNSLPYAILWNIINTERIKYFTFVDIRIGDKVKGLINRGNKLVEEEAIVSIIKDNKYYNSSNILIESAVSVKDNNEFKFSSDTFYLACNGQAYDLNFKKKDENFYIYNNHGIEIYKIKTPMQLFSWSPTENKLITIDQKTPANISLLTSDFLFKYFESKGKVILKNNNIIPFYMNYPDSKLYDQSTLLLNTIKSENPYRILNLAKNHTKGIWLNNLFLIYKSNILNVFNSFSNRYQSYQIEEFNPQFLLIKDNNGIVESLQYNNINLYPFTNSNIKIIDYPVIESVYYMWLNNLFLIYKSNILNVFNSFSNRYQSYQIEEFNPQFLLIKDNNGIVESLQYNNINLYPFTNSNIKIIDYPVIESVYYMWVENRLFTWYYKSSDNTTVIKIYSNDEMKTITIYDNYFIIPSYNSINIIRNNISDTIPLEQIYYDNFYNYEYPVDITTSFKIEKLTYIKPVHYNTNIIYPISSYLTNDEKENVPVISYSFSDAKSLVGNDDYFTYTNNNLVFIVSNNKVYILPKTIKVKDKKALINQYNEYINTFVDFNNKLKLLEHEIKKSIIKNKVSNIGKYNSFVLEYDELMNKKDNYLEEFYNRYNSVVNKIQKLENDIVLLQESSDHYVKTIKTLQIKLENEDAIKEYINLNRNAIKSISDKNTEIDTLMYEYDMLDKINIMIENNHFNKDKYLEDYYNKYNNVNKIQELKNDIVLLQESSNRYVQTLQTLQTIQINQKDEISSKDENSQKNENAIKEYINLNANTIELIYEKNKEIYILENEYDMLHELNYMMDNNLFNIKNNTQNILQRKVSIVKNKLSNISKYNELNNKKDNYLEEFYNIYNNVVNKIQELKNDIKLLKETSELYVEAIEARQTDQINQKDQNAIDEFFILNETAIKSITNKNTELDTLTLEYNMLNEINDSIELIDIQNILQKESSVINYDDYIEAEVNVIVLDFNIFVEKIGINSISNNENDDFTFSFESKPIEDFISKEQKKEFKNLTYKSSLKLSELIKNEKYSTIFNSPVKSILKGFVDNDKFVNVLYETIKIKSEELYQIENKPPLFMSIAEAKSQINILQDVVNFNGKLYSIKWGNVKKNNDNSYQYENKRIGVLMIYNLLNNEDVLIISPSNENCDPISTSEYERVIRGEFENVWIENKNNIPYVYYKYVNSEIIHSISFLLLIDPTNITSENITHKLKNQFGNNKTLYSIKPFVHCKFPSSIEQSSWTTSDLNLIWCPSGKYFCVWYTFNFGHYGTSISIYSVDLSLVFEKKLLMYKASSVLLEYLNYNEDEYLHQVLIGGIGQGFPGNEVRIGKFKYLESNQTLIDSWETKKIVNCFDIEKSTISRKINGLKLFKMVNSIIYFVLYTDNNNDSFLRIEGINEDKLIKLSSNALDISVSKESAYCSVIYENKSEIWNILGELVDTIQGSATFKV